MLEQIVAADKALFHLINAVWTLPLFDTLAPWLRNKYFWAPLYVFIAVFFLINYGRRGWYALILLALTVTLCDQLSSGFIKPLAERVRPCNDSSMTELRLLVSCGSGFSFTSSHAANHFGAAIFLSSLFWRKSILVTGVLLAWASAVSWAQVYVGVHYPLDIAGGALLGTMIGAFLGYWGKSRLGLYEISTSTQ